MQFTGEHHAQVLRCARVARDGRADQGIGQGTPHRVIHTERRDKIPRRRIAQNGVSGQVGQPAGSGETQSITAVRQTVEHLEGGFGSDRIVTQQARDDSRPVGRLNVDFGRPRRAGALLKVLLEVDRLAKPDRDLLRRQPQNLAGGGAGRQHPGSHVVAFELNVQRITSDARTIQAAAGDVGIKDPVLTRTRTDGESRRVGVRRDRDVVFAGLQSAHQHRVGEQGERPDRADGLVQAVVVGVHQDQKAGLGVLAEQA